MSSSNEASIEDYIKNVWSKFKNCYFFNNNDIFKLLRGHLHIDNCNFFLFFFFYNYLK